jgi:hypothetical protein
VAGALVLGALLNGATTLRAWHGFTVSFAAARADASWANLFNPLVLPEYLPALLTLSVSAARNLGPWLGWPLTAALLLGLGLVLRSARDRFGFVALFAGSLLLIAYTVAEDFAYGWQKSVQFAGVFVALLLPASLDALHRARTGAAAWRRLCTAALAGVAAFGAFAAVMEFREGYKWSDRKMLSADWFGLRSHVGENLRGSTVLVEPATFRMAFFHGMWAAYFLRDAHIYYAARGEENGGYLRFHVRDERHPGMGRPAGFLVSRAWGDTFDANSPRILTGRQYVLLQKSNRVLALSGVKPLNGVPDSAGEVMHFEILAHSPGNLLLDLQPKGGDATREVTWSITRTGEEGPPYAVTVSGPPPWRLRVPLLPKQRNRIDITGRGVAAAPSETPFAIRSVRIEDAP